MSLLGLSYLTAPSKEENKELDLFLELELVKDFPSCEKHLFEELTALWITDWGLGAHRDRQT